MVLIAQGVGGLPIGARSIVEAALPLAVGGALGCLAALGLAGTLNPVRELQPQALAAARRDAVVALAAGLFLFGLVTWVVVRSQELERTGRLGQVLVRPLWEVLVLVLAAAALYELQTRGAGPVEVQGRPAQVDRLQVLFPLLLIAGLAGLATRGAARLVARRGRPALTSASSARPASFLALRRLVAAPRLVLLLVTGSAVAFGLLTYSGILVASTRSAAADKARILVGSDTSLLLGDEAPPGATAGLQATVVRRFEQVTLPSGDKPVTMIAVDPRPSGPAPSGTTPLPRPPLERCCGVWRAPDRTGWARSWPGLRWWPTPARWRSARPAWPWRWWRRPGRSRA
jgi:hypothetical protein